MEPMARLRFPETQSVSPRWSVDGKAVAVVGAYVSEVRDVKLFLFSYRFGWVFLAHRSSEMGAEYKP